MSGISDKALKTPYAQNKYRYNSKELQDHEFTDGSGLEEYDYGARFQDPQLGRFVGQDPMAYKYMPVSPYSYCANDPIKFIDPDGKNIDLSQLSTKDRNMIMGLLQQLTGDKLKYNSKTHNVDIVKRVDDKSNKLKSGTELLRNLIGHDNTVTLKYNPKLVQSGGDPENEENSHNGKGTNEVVTLGGVNSQTQVATKDGTKSENQPMYLVLGEELVHSLIAMDGYTRSPDNIKENTYYSVGGTIKTEKQPLEELEAHGIGAYNPTPNAKRSSYPTENSIRGDHNLPKRVAYEPQYISQTHN